MIKELDFNYQRQFGHRDPTSSQGDAEKLSSQFPAAKNTFTERRDSECGLYGNDPRCLPLGMSSCRHASFLCHPLRCHSVQSARVPG